MSKLNIRQIRMLIRSKSRFHSEEDTHFAKIRRDGRLVLQLEYSRQSKIGKQSVDDNPEDSGNVRLKEIRFFATTISCLFLGACRSKTRF